MALASSFLKQCLFTAEWEGNDGHGGNRYLPLKRSVYAVTAMGIQSVVRGVERAKTDGASLAHVRTAGTDGCDSWRNNFLFVMAAICRCPNIRTHHLIASSFTSRFVTDYVTSLRMIMFEHKQRARKPAAFGQSERI